MKKRIKLLTLVVQGTIILLSIAAALIVVGIFNESLKWDIFGPKIEALLYGMFGSCIALACVGVAMTLVLGVQEIVKAFQSIRQTTSGPSDSPADASRGTYLKCLAGLVIVTAVLVSALAVVNHTVQKHRSKVFKHLVTGQMKSFEGRLAALLASLEAPPRNHVPRDLHDFINTLDDLSFVNKTTLYLPDLKDKSAMWGYTAWREYREEDGFAHFFVAKDFEHAIAKGLEGSPAELDALNEQTGFIWYFLVKNADGRPVGVIRIDGNSRENFREYKLGS